MKLPERTVFRAPGLLAIVFAAVFAGSTATAQQHDSDSHFDFYVLALSWSPSYCAVQGPAANKHQCARSPAFGFIVHGLWPQYEEGYPKDCKGSDQRRISRRTMDALADIMPSYGLIVHEWRTHGMCTGLRHEDYFSTLRAAYGKVSIPTRFADSGDASVVKPSDVEEAFLAANPGLPADGISVDCDRRYLREVRICLTRDLHFRSCLAIDRDACRKPAVKMPLAE